MDKDIRKWDNLEESNKSLSLRIIDRDGVYDEVVTFKNGEFKGPDDLSENDIENLQDALDDLKTLKAFKG